MGGGREEWFLKKKKKQTNRVLLQEGGAMWAWQMKTIDVPSDTLEKPVRRTVRNAW